MASLKARFFRHISGFGTVRKRVGCEARAPLMQSGRPVMPVPRPCSRLLPALFMLLVFAAHVRGEDRPDPEAVKAAVIKALPLLEAGAKGSMEQRKQCFTCHNQGLPVMALVTARKRGIAVDDGHIQTQVEFTARFLGKNKQKYLEGKGQGGQVDTAGYALWTLDNGGWKPDETTAAVAEYFLQFQNNSDHWSPNSRRPPTEQSLFTSSFVALRGLKVFGIEPQKSRIDARFEQVRAWLLKTAPQETEDRVFRLRALQIAGVSDENLRQACDDLLGRQRPDGGWSQLDDPSSQSDAYATGTVLAALHQAGGVPTSATDYQRGLAFLLSTQLEDGSWHVVSRSKPFQEYFESGYPHGKDQFISIAAASWATTALTLSLPVPAAAE